MRRRAVLGSLGSTLAVALSSGSTAKPLCHTATPRKLIKPARLQEGMTIGLIAPASNSPDDEGIRFAGAVIKSLGFRVKEGKYLYSRNLYFAGTDRERADDINTMFSDKKVDAIFCIRGGWGSPRTLPYIDFENARRNPKVFMGYSDITAVLSALYRKSGLVGFHGPIARQNYTPYTLSEFKKVLKHPQKNTVIASPPPFEAGEGWVEEENRLTRVVRGKASGALIGGNLSLLSKLIGTPYEPDFNDAILVLEDVDESPYRIDSMLTQLWLSGRLAQVAGIAIGKFTDPEYDGNSYSVEEVVRQHCEPLNVPVISGLMIGHIDDMSVVPIGIKAELDVDAGTLKLLEPAVV